MKRFSLAAGIICASLASSSALAAECGRVTIADMNWNSASLIANVDRFILEHGFGCDAELVPGDTMPTGTSMIEKGQPDIAPELWSNSMKAALEKGVSEQRLRIAGKSLTDGGEEGFWVPKYMVDKDPSLATIQGVIANAKLFKHPEDPSLSALYGCPAGWNCQITSGNEFRALKLADAGFELIDPGSGAGLAGAIARAYEREQPWVGYYWAPTAILGKYEMVKVDFGSGVKEQHFLDCISKADCENPQVTMWPPSPVHTVTTEEFASKASGGYDYLTKRSFTNARMNQLLAWMEDNQADGEIAMEHFLTSYPDMWQQWLPADAAKRVQDALAAL
ncbi:ABC transporter substrate-binding protein [Aestuariirhabdus litorea]|uniref:ABC transporter substrate-binding protein n=1 Tax=Aestuariirhabdus litorea TaxID=2528527 RepID=A0A3P3VKV1_9GAMM|nr:ABC transporter substrate-binding protein [Aestuariirhabdus litorea]RRJ82937.1 ABC transporter substrate-binding protein [Aestuariirhabdus litorea]RWW93096.1 ABC transporter substrate-binding protein [Endozoicomonadaceae bacterium GTF-13]